MMTARKTLSRRTLFGVTAGAATTALVGSGTAAPAWAGGAVPGGVVTPRALPTPAEALTMLKDGNAAWVKGALTHPNLTVARREEVAKGQEPFAVVLCCIDSRVPPEFVFDRGLGDLFVVRDAAAAPDDFVEGSLEYGPGHAGTPLVVVLGHQRCGAVTEGVKALTAGTALDGHLAEVEEAIRPAWDTAKATVGDGADQDTMVEETIRELVRQTVAKLLENATIKPLVAEGKVEVHGAYYSLDTGEVTFGI